MRVFIVSLLLSFCAAASDLDVAQKLYDRTDYQATLDVLKKSAESKTGPTWELAGKAAYQLGDFKKSIEFFEKASQANPSKSTYVNWLGRAWGRRAETANPFMAPGYASKARQYFEQAVALNPRDVEAVNDLFSYYLEAPGFLGGGMDKAMNLAEQIRTNDPAEYHFALAQIAQRRKQYDLAEGQLRKAAELAPKQVGRVLDLAKFLARRGKYGESETIFQQAASVDPSSKRILFARAEAYIETNRNLDLAKKLLNEYIHAPLSPDDPSRDDARRLLKRVTAD
ncbi:tetratricopeptide repeat protein [uncultured Paludibaculum sp.]|uniref:tetratricopeptide repeat protein n=1 Tax=uncultured Paludibaculum sp. TaxID=1765020 RepID=UPI002AAC2A60|nr:tetratricopeptide repeat protein [uncultured Paludibaculum sp.]